MYEKITDSDIQKRAISALANTPNRRVPFGESAMDAAQLKARFDLLPKFIAAKLNEVFTGLSDGELAKALMISADGKRVNLAALVACLLEGEVDEIKIKSIYKTISLMELANLVLQMQDGLKSGELAEGLMVEDGVSLKKFYFDSRNNKGEDGKSITIVSTSESNAARSFALGLRTDGSIGKTATLTGFAFGVSGKLLTVNGKEFNAAEGKWIYNQAVNSSTASAYSMIIYDKDFVGSFTANNYGVAIVLDASGKLTRIYDGANVGYYTENGKAATAGFTSSTYATVAFNDLVDGETLIIFPDDGGTNAARSFALGLRTDGSIGKIATLTGFTFGLDNKVISINGKSFEVVHGKWLYNTEVTSDNASSFSLLIYDRNYTGSFSTNGYGVAAVFDANGVLTRIYDGANRGYYTADGKADETHFSTLSFATVAFDELNAGETLLVFPNDGGYNIITFSDGTIVNIPSGRSPVKGADYFTPDDVSYMVDKVAKRIDLSKHQTVVDESLETESKEVAGAINELLKKFEELEANMPITDLTGTTWVFNENINPEISEGVYIECLDIAFVCDGITYRGICCDSWSIFYNWNDPSPEEVGNLEGWNEEKYRTITFIHDESGLLENFGLTDNTFINWLKANAVQQK